jgi:hypothetical protein
MDDSLQVMTKMFPGFDGDDGSVTMQSFKMPRVTDSASGEEIPWLSELRGCELVQDDDMVVVYPDQVDAIVEYLTKWKASL